MIKDKFGQLIFSERDICDLYLTDPTITPKNVLTDAHVSFDTALDLVNTPKLVDYAINDQTVAEFDAMHSNTWFMPAEYENLDIAKWVLDHCSNEEELQRAGEELLLFQERDMFVLLQYLKYLVDTMRENNIVWGVGRGSSVASFVLYLIGVHKINSLYYQLSITEFLK
jgi:DNA polymerase III alpha subunit